MPSTPSTTGAGAAPDRRILDAVKRFWGYDSLRPLQHEAIRAGVEHRDSLVVMPTGGGKSLCYQVPPVLANRLDVVVSPLISLMKDQVDGLRENGYPAAAVHSHLSAAQRDEIRRGLNKGEFRLLFISPERLLQGDYLDEAARLNVRCFAIDEAHCISHWGHDFRPEYRQLSVLKRRFPDASVHAYTATATQRVRDDIVRELGLKNPAVLVGCFDRPNLIYRVVPRTDRAGQVLEAVRRHAGEAAIVYTISRKDTEIIAATLKASGVRAEHYHAGMDKGERARVQEAFAAESIDVVVATVAFGMGIDRSNVRCVIHATMPKSIEHYQQETGRAGRDGLEAECLLLYSSSDAIRREELIRQSAAEAPDPQSVIEASRTLLGHIKRYASRTECRHRTLSEYFGQAYGQSGCGACDVCLGEVAGMGGSTVIAQKILSCIARTGQTFGAKHVADVLRGAETEGVLRRGHDRLSTFGLLREFTDKSIVNLINQVVDQGLVDRAAGDYPTLRLNAESASVLKGVREVLLTDPGLRKARKSRVATEAWEGVDTDLFERLRLLRKAIATQRQVPAYVVLGDETLRALARHRPASIASFGRVRGVGAKKQADLGAAFVESIAEFCSGRGLATDVDLATDDSPQRPRSAPRSPGSGAMSAGAMEAARLFDAGASIEAVQQALSRARSTVAGYLVEYIASKRPSDISRWVDDGTYRRVVEATIASDADQRLKPVFEHLKGEVSYDTLRLVAAHLRASSTASP